jgi:hypothetical protein
MRGGTWLRARASSLGWDNDFDVTQPLTGKARAVAFGTLDGKSEILVGAGTYVHRWDPRSATTTPLPPLAARPTAVAAGSVAGRSVVAAACGYDGVLQIIDASGGNWHPAPTAPAGDEKIVLTVARGRAAVGLLGQDGVRLVEADTGEPVLEMPGRALAMADTPTGAIAAWLEGDRIRVRQLESGETVDRDPGILVDPQEWWPAVAVGQVGRSLVVATAEGSSGVVHVWNALTGEPLGDPFRFDFPVRALAVGDVDGRIVLAAVNDSDHESGFVRTREVSAVRERRAASNAVGGAVLGVGLLGGSLRAFGEHVGLVDPSSGAVIDPDPPPELVATLLLGSPATRLASPHSTGVRRSNRVKVTRPSDWPTTAVGYGRARGRNVRVCGSYSGAVVVLDAETGAVLDSVGPDLPYVLYLGAKTSSGPVTGVAVGAGAIASAWDGAVRLYDAQSLTSLAVDWITATAVRSVAMGVTDSTRLLATGGEGGGVALWDLDGRRRMAGITLDRPVADVWLVRNEPLVVARTSDLVFHAFDVVGE